VRSVVEPWGTRARVVEHGRLRAGTKSEKGAPVKSKTWRATSSDRDALEDLAAIYGGTVRTWQPADGRSQYEVHTTSPMLKVVLPPDALSGPSYEHWGRGICLRRCDGITMETPIGTPDGQEWLEEPCACKADGRLLCKPKIRLSVILPEIRFGGVWRLDSSSWNACDELPGMVDLIGQMSASGGMPIVELHLEERNATRLVTDRSGNEKAQKQNFIVPKLVVPVSAQALAAGAGTFGAIAGPERPALLRAPEPELDDVDPVDDPLGELSGEARAGGEQPDTAEQSTSAASPDDIEDAEIIDETAEVDAQLKHLRTQVRRRFEAWAKGRELDREWRDAVWQAMARRASDRRTVHSAELGVNEMGVFVSLAGDVVEERVVPEVTAAGVVFRKAAT
jgi:hypothetical protein